MTVQKFYKKPAVEIAECAVERGFCVTLEFFPGTEGSPNQTSFGADDMSRTIDEEAW